MPIEIERKFLVKNDTWRTGAVGTNYHQGYITTHQGHAVRVRIAGDKSFLTIKGPASPLSPLSRAEFEYEIPVEDALYMLNNLCEPEQIQKTRYTIPSYGHLWEIDEFHGNNNGLVVAEIELKSENESFDRPDWLGDEVSMDSRYTNASLARHPFSKWECDR